MASTTRAPAPPARRRILHPGSAGMIVGGLLAAVGSLLPWVMTPLGSLSGTVGAGLLTLSAGFIAVAGSLLPFRKVAIAHCLAPGIAVAVIVAWQVARLIQISAASDSWGQLLPGMGLVMVAGGGVVLLTTGYRLLTSR